MKKFLVTLDPSKCVSYTLPDGRKFLPGRSKVLPESDIGPFASAGVFLVQLHSDVASDDKEAKKKKQRFKRRKAESPEVNPDDKPEGED